MKMKKYIYIVVALLTITQLANAQNSDFIKSGRIVYERKTQFQKIVQGFIDMIPQMAAQSSNIMNMYNSKYKPFQVTTYDLSFTPTKSLYGQQEKQPDTHQEYDRMFDLPGQDNKVFTDFTTGKKISTKGIFGTVLNITDSVTKLKWRITDETREIAGFECRRANALINDSIYIVAFYTTQITPSIGPESFNGLPGAILRLSLPHLHTDWIATQVFTTVDESKVSEAQINKKLKTVDGKEFQSTIKTLASNMGGDGAGNYLMQYINF